MAEEKTIGRCMTCKGPKEMKDIEVVTTKTGGRMARGTCVDCGKTVCKFLPKEKKAEEE